MKTLHSYKWREYPLNSNSPSLQTIKPLFQQKRYFSYPNLAKNYFDLIFPEKKLEN